MHPMRICSFGEPVSAALAKLAANTPGKPALNPAPAARPLLDFRNSRRVVHLGFVDIVYLRSARKTIRQFDLLVSGGHLSSGLMARKTNAARAPPAKLATRKIQMLATLESPITVIPTATAGLKAPPEI